MEKDVSSDGHAPKKKKKSLKCTFLFDFCCVCSFLEFCRGMDVVTNCLFPAVHRSCHFFFVDNAALLSPGLASPQAGKEPPVGSVGFGVSMTPRY